MIRAVSRAHHRPWFDKGNILLIGLGEGAAAVVLWDAEVEVDANAVAGWTCTALRAMKAPAGGSGPIDAGSKLGRFGPSHRRS